MADKVIILSSRPSKILRTFDINLEMNERDITDKHFFWNWKVRLQDLLLTRLKVNSSWGGVEFLFIFGVRIIICKKNGRGGSVGNYKTF